MRLSRRAYYFWPVSDKVIRGYADSDALSSGICTLDPSSGTVLALRHPRALVLNNTPTTERVIIGQAAAAVRVGGTASYGDSNNLGGREGREGGRERGEGGREGEREGREERGQGKVL